MRLITEDRVAYVIIMGNLHAVKNYGVFHLGRIADDGTVSYESITSYICAVADFCVLSYYSRTADKRARRNLCALCYPYVIAYLVIIVFGESLCQR